MSEGKKWNSNDIVNANELIHSPKFKCDKNKIMKILVNASTKAKTSGLEIVYVKGIFSNEEIKAMKIIMETKGYDMWKAEGGSIFVPKIKNVKPFGINTQPWWNPFGINTQPWGKQNSKIGFPNQGENNFNNSMFGSGGNRFNL